MRVLIETNDDAALRATMDALQSIYGAAVLGTEKDFVLQNIFGREDFMLCLDSCLSYDSGEASEKAFNKFLVDHADAREKIIDRAMALNNEHFDANYGVNNSVVEEEVECAYAEAFNLFCKKFEAKKVTGTAR